MYQYLTRTSVKTRINSFVLHWVRLSWKSHTATACTRGLVTCAVPDAVPALQACIRRWAQLQRQ